LRTRKETFPVESSPTSEKMKCVIFTEGLQSPREVKCSPMVFSGELCLVSIQQPGPRNQERWHIRISALKGSSLDLTSGADH
ncbi:hypothetical protein STEG23_022153, partial [Scotinomys teguina]